MGGWVGGKESECLEGALTTILINPTLRGEEDTPEPGFHKIVKMFFIANYTKHNFNWFNHSCKLQNKGVCLGSRGEIVCPISGCAPTSPLRYYLSPTPFFLALYQLQNSCMTFLKEETSSSWLHGEHTHTLILSCYDGPYWIDFWSPTKHWDAWNTQIHV